MKKYLLIGLLLILVPQIMKSQNALISREYFLDQNQITFTLPQDYFFEEGVEERLDCIYSDEFRGLKPTYSDKIVSKDKNIAIYIDIAPIYSKDSIHVYMQLYPENNYLINEVHINHIKADLQANSEGKHKYLSDSFIKYKSNEFAREAFNADTVITYPLKVYKKKMLKEKYNYCQVMIIQKSGRGYIALYTFYNDKAKEKLDEHLNAIKKIFWYREPKDFIKVVNMDTPAEVILPHLK